MSEAPPLSFGEGPGVRPNNYKNNEQRKTTCILGAFRVG